MNPLGHHWRTLAGWQSAPSQGVFFRDLLRNDVANNRDGLKASWRLEFYVVKW